MFGPISERSRQNASSRNRVRDVRIIRGLPGDRHTPVSQHSVIYLGIPALSYLWKFHHTFLPRLQSDEVLNSNIKIYLQLATLWISVNIQLS